MTLAPLQLDTSLSPPRREAACLTAEKRRWKMVVAGPSKMPKNFPPTSKKREGGNSQNFFDSFGDLMGREGGRAEQLAYGYRSLCNFSPSSSSVRCCIKTQTSRNQSILPFAFECLFRELLSFVLMSSEVADWDQTFSRPTPDPLHLFCR